MDHNQKHRDLAPHLEPSIPDRRDLVAKHLYLVMRRLCRVNRQKLWDEANRQVMDAILYGTSTGPALSFDGLVVSDGAVVVSESKLQTPASPEKPA